MADIRLLCAASREESIFSLVDAVGMRDGKKALSLLHDLSMDIPQQYVFSMLVRQIRLLIQTKVVLDEKGGSKAVVEVCDIKSEWQAKKLINQARRFTLSDLENIHKRLDRIDEDSKIGKITLDAVLASLLASITSR